MAMTLIELFNPDIPFKWMVVSNFDIDTHSVIDVWCYDNIENYHHKKLWDIIASGWVFVNKEDAVLLMLTFS